MQFQKREHIGFIYISMFDWGPLHDARRAVQF